jgi:hypothetical protein
MTEGPSCQRGAVERPLTKQHQAVQRDISQADAAREHDRLQERRRESKTLVRQGLEPDAIARGIQEPSFPPEQLKRAGNGSRLTAELLPRRRRRSIDRTSGRVKQYPVASTHHPHGDQHIVENRVRRDRFE